MKYQYGKVEIIGMPLFMDDIAAVGAAITSEKEYRIVEEWRLKRK